MTATLTSNQPRSRGGADCGASPKNRRILVIDDNVAIHRDFRKILAGDQDTPDLEEARAAAFGENRATTPEPPYEIDSAYQGEDGFAKVSEAVKRRRPYALAFVDMRMPPGWDGIETVERIWQVDTEIQTVICSAYSDYPWSEIVGRLGQSDRLLILKKPFDNIEVRQLASALSEKRHLSRQSQLKMADLDRIVKRRATALAKTNARLQMVVGERRKSEARISCILQSAPDSIITMDETGRIVDFNAAAERTFGYSCAEAMGRPLAELIIPQRLRAEHKKGLQRYPTAGEGKLLGKWLELPAIRRDGAEFPVEATVAAIPQGGRLFFTAILRDVTDRKRTEEELLRLAFRDPLTGLKNRAAFIDRLSHAIARYQRREDCLFAVLFLDLDRFKNINDSLGHIMGDKVLIQTAERLQACQRSADTVARLGGDEFAMLVEDVRNVGDAVRLAERIQAALQKPFDLDGKVAFVGASIGIAAPKTADIHAEDILRDVDTAMYEAKAAGRNRCVLFDSSMHEKAKSALKLENDLRRAVEREEFRVAYQPIVSLQSNRITGFEALVRWKRPESGLLQPGEFMAAAEETRLIIPIGWFVFREACRRLCEWREEFPSAASLKMNINFSPTQIAEARFVDRVAKIAGDSGAESRSLVFEVTENVVFKNTEIAAQRLSKLASLGVCLCIDDFGTGYASLSSLRQFPFDILKIDRTFVSGARGAEQDWRIVESIIGLAHSLGVQVVAEGVETGEQLERLKALECDYAQGYWFSEPVADTEAAQLLFGEGRAKSGVLAD